MTATSRRALLRAAAGLGAASLMPPLGWAAAGSPAFLAAAGLPDGSFWLLGLTARGEEIFRLPLPDRGHAAAAHPERPEAVAFARRPGTFALVVDCAEGRVAARLDAPEGRHFYGHGAFSADGRTLFTTENAIAEEAGRVGLWDASDGYRRLGEVDSGGVGPHEILLMPGGARLAVANGGILTDPSSGRAMLNLATMAPNLSYLDAATGAVVETLELPEALARNSIRHIAAAGRSAAAWPSAKAPASASDAVRAGAPSSDRSARSTSAESPSTGRYKKRCAMKVHWNIGTRLSTGASGTSSQSASASHGRTDGRRHASAQSATKPSAATPPTTPHSDPIEP